MKAQFEKQALAERSRTGCDTVYISALIATAAATAKLDRVINLKKALKAEGRERTDVMNEMIMLFLQKESKFKAFFPEGSLFSKKDLETVRDGCRLRQASRGEVLSKSGEFIEDIYIVVSGYIALENNSTGVVTYREVEQGLPSSIRYHE
jgi:CRP-like cAMP-binding protein